jgi:hypothetical protein
MATRRTTAGKHRRGKPAAGGAAPAPPAAVEALARLLRALARRGERPPVASAAPDPAAETGPRGAQ